MTNRPLKTPALHRKSEAARRANQIIRGRTLLMMLVLGIGTFLLLFWKLYDLQINRYDEMQARAVHQQTREVSVNASRGTIYDKNHNILASSTTAEKVIIDPLRIGLYVQNQIKTQDEAAAKALEKGQTYTRQPIRDQSWIARGLSRILDMDQERIEERMSHTTWEYVVLRQKVEKETADEVRKFINGQIDEEGNEIPEGEQRTLTGVYLEPDPKRYYPYNAMAANVLGFVNSEDQGSVGLESKYDGDLSGESGMTVSAKINRINEPLLFQYEQYFDAEDGSDLLLTLDINVQIALEKGIESMLSKFDAAKGGTGIVMDVDSGAILGMASYPNYDSNQPGVLYDEKLKAKLDQQLADIEKDRDRYEAQDAAARAERQELARQTGEEVPEEEPVSSYEKAVTKTKNDTLQSQWRNKCIDSTYEPGSTFKPITLAAALEEGVINMNSTFECSGSVMVKGWDKPFNCSRSTGHGHQILKEAVGNSCNPAFIKIGQAVGTSTYYQYLKSFGLMEETGVDMIGEVPGIFTDEKSFNTNLVSLASYSFGQTFNVTPLALIRAQAACINGGYLYEPYVVEQVLDGDGSILHQHETRCIRQVISEETSAKVRECLEYVVAEGTGRNGQVAGYRIGGKTGTADKTGTKTADNPKGDIVVSFMCFAPADDPQYIMLITMDTPSRTTGTFPSGGNMVAPTASQIMSEILPVLGVEPDYTAAQLEGADAAVPNVVGQDFDAAKARMENAGFTFRTVGSGAEVTAQTPEGGAIVPNNASIILYLGEEKSTEQKAVPNVVGMTASEANQALTNAGLIMRVAGTTSTGSGNVRAISQDRAEGTELAPGSVVTVRFGDSSVRD
ncbi:penicillin-binding transpeptidase domain-containing protein [uncultured Oscillibacter sp.]|uniref:penicillin-binding transpeptidase domain-containing protein n=1 Tax=uncultured Oscillibacter sp. TaxID=876091 RepID=UPI0025D953B8|nr:penicillin-binding transpeptidase domain-containing protein [uncultured Oscillibacter sp.]